MQPTKQYIGIILGYGEAEVVSTGTDFDQVYKRTGEIWEEQFSKGDGQLLPDFKTFKELYQNKISQQQSLSQALRKHQNALKENEPEHGAQRALFNDLRILLETKTNILRKAEQGLGDVEDTSGIQFGDTNIMQITQG